jgi:hypothetical protein
MFTRRSKTRKACPTGQIRRKCYKREYGSTIKRNGYLVRRSGRTVRVYPKSLKIFVKSRCIEDRGLPGKGVAPGSNSIVEVPLKKGELTKFGYHSSYPKTVRRDALKKAASAYGPLSLYHKLDAVAKLSSRQAPAAAAVFARDRNWVRATYPIRKSLSPRA